MPLVEDWDKFVDRSQIYGDDVLFHTEAFQVLTEVAVSNASAAGPLKQRMITEWNWTALQMALRWMSHCTGASSLPMSVESIQWYTDKVVTQFD